MNKLLYICLVLGFLGACNNPDSPASAKKSFVDVNGIDTSIKPGDNFFRYVNGRWYDTAKIADDQTGVGSYSFMNRRPCRSRRIQAMTGSCRPSPGRQSGRRLTRMA